MSILIGFFLGLAAAVFAVASGWGLLVALGLYAMAGATGTLLGAAALTIPVHTRQMKTHGVSG